MGTASVLRCEAGKGGQATELQQADSRRTWIWLNKKYGIKGWGLSAGIEEDPILDSYREARRKPKVLNVLQHGLRALKFWEPLLCTLTF